MLVARYTLRAHRAAFLLGAGEEADDVVQEAFVKAFRHLSEFRADEAFGPWLLRIVVNETKNLARSRRRRAVLPGERRMSLEQARHRVSFPILVPAALGPPPDVVASDGGRVVSLIYPRTRYGPLRMDEFAGHPDQIYFEKIVHTGDVTPVTVNGTKGLWIKGPHELVYLTPDGSSAVAPPRLTTGNTLLWGTPRVALRLEGDVGQAAALAIADSAR